MKLKARVRALFLFRHVFSTMLVRSARASTPVAGRRHAASAALDRRSLDVYARARQDQLQGDNSSAPISRSGPAKRGKVPRADVALPEELDKTVTGIINGEDAVADCLCSAPRKRLESDLLLGLDRNGEQAGYTRPCSRALQAFAAHERTADGPPWLGATSFRRLDFDRLPRRDHARRVH